MILKYYRFEVSRVLIVAPKKVAEATWQAEAAKWEHTRMLRFSTVMGTAAQRIRALVQPADVYVINRDNLPWLVDYYQNNWPFDMVVLDESTSFKNHQSKRWKRLKAVLGRIRRIVELSGTPSPQGLIDLWAQVFLLDGGQRLGKTISGFRDYWFIPDQRNRTQVFSYKPKEGSERDLITRISDICISMKAADYLQLPPLVVDDIPVMLDREARKKYDYFEREMLLEVDEDTITAGTAAVLSGKLMQLCGGAIYGDDRQVHELHSCKVEALAELFEQLAGEPALVFYGYQHEIPRIKAALEAQGKRVRMYQTPQDMEHWNAGGRIDALLAHPASCAYGLNLQAGGRHVVWFGLSWSQELTAQANARLYRQGQEKPVIVHRLVVQEARDVDAVASVDGKTREQDALMESLKARIRKVKEHG